MALISVGRGHTQVVDCVLPSHDVTLAAGLQLCLRILADGLQHVVTRLVSPPSAGAHQGLSYQLAQPIEHGSPRFPIAPAHGLRRLQGPTACKYGQAPQQTSLWLRKQVVTPD